MGMSLRHTHVNTYREFHMATVMAQNDVIEVSAFSDFAEQIGVNIYHYKVGVVTGAPTYEQLAVWLEERFSPEYIDWLCDAASWSGIKLRLLAGPTGPAPWYSAADAAAGTSGTPIPRQLSGMIRRRVNLAGARGRGRVYIPFPGATMMNGASVSAAGMTVLGNIRDATMGAPGILTSTPSVGTTAQLIPGLLFGGSGNVTNDLVAVDLAGEFATQKRRGFFGRPNSLPSELGS